MTINKAKIEAKDRILGDLFVTRGASKFVVPDYQRRFIWKTKQLIDFVDAVYQNDSGYFIGTIVLVGPDPKTYAMEILDGQQRLTCLFFLLKTIYDQLIDESPKTGEVDDLIENIELVLYKSEKNLKNIRLVFNESSMQPFFNFLISENDPLEDQNVHAWIKQKEKDSKNATSFEKSAGKKSVTKLYANYRDINDYIGQFTIEELIVLCRKIFELQIIEVICKETSIANTLFEGLNSKGIKLTNAELIKNKLYETIDQSLLPGSSKRNCKTNWEGLDLLFFSNPREGLIDKYLRHYYIARAGYIQGKELYDKYVEEIKLDVNNLDDYTYKMLRYGEYYIAINNQKLSPHTHPIHKLHKSNYDALNSFGSLDNDQIYEVLIGLILQVDERGSSSISTKELNILLQKFWTFCFRAKFLPISPSKYENVFASYCLKLEEWTSSNKSIFKESIDFIEDKLAPLVKDDGQLVEVITEDLDYKQRNIQLLTKIFTDLLSQEHPVVYKSPSIEHIVPQRPEKKWGLKRSDVQDIVHKLGNLTLLDQSENYISEDELFSNKVSRCYSKNAYSLNKDLGKLYKSFTSSDTQTLAETIDKRGKKIAEDLSKLYSLSTV